MPTSKKVTRDPKTPSRRSRVSRAEATQRFLDATIELLFEKAVPDISLHEIAAKTGMNHGYVFRYFGTRLDLFTAVTDELARLATLAGQSEVDRQAELGITTPTFDLVTMNASRKYTRQRQRVIQYLVTAGVDPARFGDTSRELINVIVERLLTLGLNERFARAQAIKIAVLVWAEESLIETLGITEEEVVDVRQLAIDEIRRHKEITKALGWK